jgi:hypothetical protein
MNAFRVTYEIVTPESAEHGDSAEYGFVYPGAWQFPLEQCDADPNMRLREAIDLAGDRLEDSGRWFTQFDGRTNYETGAETRYSIHPPESITAASYGRLRRLLSAN